MHAYANTNTHIHTTDPIHLNLDTVVTVLLHEKWQFPVKQMVGDKCLSKILVL